MGIEGYTGTTTAYSNNPPLVPSGGAQVVIKNTRPTRWAGPGKALRDSLWNKMDAAERQDDTNWDDITTSEEKSIDVLTFEVPESLRHQQYDVISNAYRWPLDHSKEPKLDLPIEQVEEAYEGYTQYNLLGGEALRRMPIEDNSRTWVHDYQCDTVPGMVYSRHIPWPTLDHLESVELKSEAVDESGHNIQVPVIDAPFFRDLVELHSTRALTTLQRPIDQVNFLMTAAYVAGRYKKVDPTFPDRFSMESDNPLLQNIAEDIYDPAKREMIRDELLKEIDMESVTQFTLFGARTSVMNIPVGHHTEDVYTKAQRNKHNLRNTDFKFNNEKGWFDVFHAGLSDGETANLTATDEAQFSKSHPPKLEDFLEPIRGRKWVLSTHRNDYTKGTTTKLEAAEDLFANDSEMKDNVTFLFLLQPTRGDVAGYKEYAEAIFTKMHELRQTYGPESVVALPAAIAYDDVLGVMCQDEVAASLSLGDVDGHDLTARELVDSNNKNSAIANLTSSGIGARDVLSVDSDGAFVVENPKDADEVARILRYALDSENEYDLCQRFDFMKARSERFDANNFLAKIDEAYVKAMEYRFGENWRESFQHPAGDYIDRKGEYSTPATERPDYIKDLFETALRRGSLL